ncbi:489_t:CDS:2 [Ambispora leptoticha]|uniref:489_t:CDS:1 n=1 Tax=Ambispora leptoticha TaxID=144679 RepID=A0A9N8WHU3_9GLOM|nr:489_t:CDS:2 [Ambispora leptoticha]
MAREISQQILDQNFGKVIESTELLRQDEFLSSSSLSLTSLTSGINSNNPHELQPNQQLQINQLPLQAITIIRIQDYFFESLDLGVSIKKMVSQFPESLQQDLVSPSDLVQCLENIITDTSATTKNKALLGFCYEYGIGTTPKLNLAFNLYHEAALRNDKYAQNFCYSKGHGGKVDLYKAAYWYRRSAQLENSHGQFTLGAMYWSGRGVSRDLHDAFKYLRRAYGNGNETAIRFLLWRG